MENENTTGQNLGEEANTVLSGKFIAPNVHVRKEERSQNHLSFQLTKLGEKSQLSPMEVEERK